MTNFVFAGWLGGRPRIARESRADRSPAPPACLSDLRLVPRAGSARGRSRRRSREVPEPAMTNFVFAGWLAGRPRIAR